MRSYLDAKAMAKSLRQGMAERQISLSHSECLELVSRQFGLANWNTLHALIDDVSGQRTLTMPQGWHVSGMIPNRHYRCGLDPEAPGVAMIESRFSKGGGVDLAAGQFATLMQSTVADEFRGQHVRLTASLRTEDAGAGSIWLRVDGAAAHTLRFDNLMERETGGALRGTQGWTERSVLLDVPEEAASIHYGFFLLGYGRVWAKAFRLDVAGEAVSPARPHRHLPKPENLDFGEPACRPA